MTAAAAALALACPASEKSTAGKQSESTSGRDSPSGVDSGGDGGLDSGDTADEPECPQTEVAPAPEIAAHLGPEVGWAISPDGSSLVRLADEGCGDVVALPTGEVSAGFCFPGRGSIGDVHNADESSGSFVVDLLTDDGARIEGELLASLSTGDELGRVWFPDDEVQDHEYLGNRLFVSVWNPSSSQYALAGFDHVSGTVAGLGSADTVFAENGAGILYMGGLGDVNGDGLEDAVVNASGCPEFLAGTSGEFDAAEVYTGGLPLAQPCGQQGARAVGDMDGDGTSDFGVESEEDPNELAGLTLVYSGGSATPFATIRSGPESGERNHGIALLGVGDLEGDGRAYAVARVRYSFNDEPSYSLVAPLCGTISLSEDAPPFQAPGNDGMIVVYGRDHEALTQGAYVEDVGESLDLVVW